MYATNHPNGFSLELARDLAVNASVAYETEPMFIGSDAIVEDALLDVRAVIHRFDHRTVLAFRGTTSLANWLLDLDVIKKPLSCGVMVHAGFLKAADALLPRIINELLPAGADRASLKPIQITGHSLGGALASLVALFLQREGWPVQAVYTFASPRVGNPAWRKTYNDSLGEKSYRVIAEGDAVPLVPGVLDSYRHVGQEILLRRDGRVYACPPHWWELLCDSVDAARALQSGDVDFLVRYHSIDKDYLTLLNRACHRS